MAATTTTSLSTTLSSLSLHHHRHYHDASLLSSLHPSFAPKHPKKPLFLRLKFTPIKANSSDIDTSVFDTDPEEISSFSSPERPEDFIEPPPFYELPMESEEEIARAYEELYGPAYSGESYLGNNVHVMDSDMKAVTGLESGVKRERVKDGFEERVIQVRRVNKVVKGGKQLNFRAVVVIGDKQGNVGVGVGKAKEVTEAVEKSCFDARRNIIRVPMTKHKTFPHRVEVKNGAAKVMLRPARPGTGVIAGGAVRIVLEMAGVENALGKQLGCDNVLNNARATILAVQQMRLFHEVAALRGIPVQEMWK